MTRHHSCRVSPFGHPRIHARLTAPRGISQPPTSFIGSQCQGIHHAPLNTYNTKPKNESPETLPQRESSRFYQKFALHRRHTTHKDHALQMLATTIHKSNTTPHHQSRATTAPPTTHSGQGKNGPVVSKPNSVSDDFPRRHFPAGPLSLLSAPDLHPLQVHAIQRFDQGHRTPTRCGRAWFSWCSLERR